MIKKVLKIGLLIAFTSPILLGLVQEKACKLGEFL
jgi:hypothetical protein